MEEAFLGFVLGMPCGWLGSRVVSVLDSGAEGPVFKSQLRSPIRSVIEYGLFFTTPRLACGKYTQPYSLEGGSDAASDYHVTVATCNCL